jgi:hypothetical protein
MQEYNLGHGIIEKILLFDDHKSSDKERAISTTTLLGSSWKAQRDLLKDIPVKLEQVPMMRRSSTIGVGYHLRAEAALAIDPLVDAMERYNEKEIDGVWISGTFDLVYHGHLMDHKTGYGKSFSEDKIEKARLQMSIYRWLNQDDMFIQDRAFVLFVSQTVNAYDSYKIELMSIDETEDFIKKRIKEIEEQETIDCTKKPYNQCNYCSYDEKACKQLYKDNSGGF